MGKMPKKAYASIGGIAVGAISVFCSFTLFFARIGSSVQKNTYGGDAYTGIQNAAASTGNNVYDLASICSRGFGLILLIIGLALICFFLHQLLSEVEFKSSANPLKKTETEEKPPVASEDPVEEAGEQAPEEAAPQEDAEAKPSPEVATWTCECGFITDGSFCPQCGKPKTVE